METPSSNGLEIAAFFDQNLRPDGLPPDAGAGAGAAAGRGPR